jgi:hypothetical protein
MNPGISTARNPRTDTEALASAAFFLPLHQSVLSLTTRGCSGTTLSLLADEAQLSKPFLETVSAIQREHARPMGCALHPVLMRLSRAVLSISRQIRTCVEGCRFG